MAEQELHGGGGSKRRFCAAELVELICRVDLRSQPYSGWVLIEVRADVFTTSWMLTVLKEIMRKAISCFNISKPEDEAEVVGSHAVFSQSHVDKAKELTLPSHLIFL